MAASKRKHAKAWYDGSHYTKKQPFATFLTCHGEMIPENLKFTLKKIKALVPEIKNSIALEIGPGLAPVILHLSFHTSYLVEQSKEMVRTLSKKEKRKNVHYLVGDISHLPKSLPKVVDIVVMSEVLTHVRPAKRISIVKKIARMSSSLLIVERPRTTYTKFLQTLYPLMEGSRTAQQQRDIYATYTDVKPLIQALRSAGFDVEVTKVVSGETYSIIAARKR